MRKRTRVKLKIVLTLACGGYSVNEAKKWLKKYGAGIGEGTYYRYSRFFVDLPIEELSSLCGERIYELTFWSPLELNRIRMARLNYFQVLNPIAAIEVEDEAEAKAEQFLERLRCA